MPPPAAAGPQFSGSWNVPSLQVATSHSISLPLCPPPPPQSSGPIPVLAAWPPGSPAWPLGWESSSILWACPALHLPLSGAQVAHQGCPSTSVQLPRGCQALVYPQGPVLSCRREPRGPGALNGTGTTRPRGGGARSIPGEVRRVRVQGEPQSPTSPGGCPRAEAQEGMAPHPAGRTVGVSPPPPSLTFLVCKAGVGLETH